MRRISPWLWMMAAALAWTANAHAQQIAPAPDGLAASLRAKADAAAARGPFAPRWDSLENYRAPGWFRDAKFGIFIHWGVYSVPAFGNEWYSHNMYVPGHKQFEHHVKTWGAQVDFGYKDFIPLFKAERFDAQAWIDLFADAGARYVVPVAEHGDGFAMYGSALNPWNAAAMGPHRDVDGELIEAARKRGLRVGLSSHRAEHFWWFNPALALEPAARDPRFAGLYGPAAPRTLEADDARKEPDPVHLETWRPPTREFLDDWLARTVEIADKYHPDLIYLDWWIAQPAFQPYLQRFAAYYYNQAAARGQGVVLNSKMQAFPESASVLDIERGKLDAIRLLPWQTDTSLSTGSWGYIAGDKYRSAASVIDELADVVSKNGNLLLNVGPRADGTIPEEAQKSLRGIGQWLRVNGEAIYGSRPWLVYGEGPTRVASSEKYTDVQQYTADDVRYTTNEGGLYAIALGWPATGELRLKSLFAGNPYLGGEVCAVRLLGSTTPLAWRQSNDGLHVVLPSTAPDEAAWVFRIDRAGNKACPASAP